MAKVRLTKNELRKQKEELGRFQRYLPMLQLREQQLQREVNKTSRQIDELKDKIESYTKEVYPWIDVFGENVYLENIIKVKEVVTESGNIAGVDIPVFSKVEFQEKEYDFLTTPLWIDRGLEAIKEMASLKAQIDVKKRQEKVLREELRIATQRVNLFEKIKIPEAKENIRIITIYLGDQQTAAVIRGKFAKSKMAKKS